MSALPKQIDGLIEKIIRFVNSKNDEFSNANKEYEQIINAFTQKLINSTTPLTMSSTLDLLVSTLEEEYKLKLTLDQRVAVVKAMKKIIQINVIEQTQNFINDNYVSEEIIRNKHIVTGVIVVSSMAFFIAALVFMVKGFKSAAELSFVEIPAKEIKNLLFSDQTIAKSLGFCSLVLGLFVALPKFIHDKRTENYYKQLLPNDKNNKDGAVTKSFIEGKSTVTAKNWYNILEKKELSSYEMIFDKKSEIAILTIKAIKEFFKTSNENNCSTGKIKLLIDNISRQIIKDKDQDIQITQ